MVRDPEGRPGGLSKKPDVIRNPLFPKEESDG